LTPEVRPTEIDLAGAGCTLGRAETCDVVVGRVTVSRLHARVEAAGPRFLLRDAASANGTFVNGRRIQEPHLLADRDEIGLGAAEPVLRFVDPDPTVLAAGRLRFDEAGLRFVLGGQPLDLTPSELRLLRYLHQRAGTVCARAGCAEAVWGADYPPGHESDALDRLVSNLRRKLRAADPSAAPLQTRSGLGYLLDP
jgi:DNA-binding response OmpR family regulator